MKIRNRTIRHKESEKGYVLLGVLILLVIFVIAMTVAAPRIAASIQRDRDMETMERGKQYIRAIQLYYRKFNAYPPNIEALVKTNNIRFLRKRYIDPITSKDDWKPIQFGQNKAPIAMGFFGQPLGGTGGAVLAGTGPGGGNGLQGSGMFGNSGPGSTSPTGGLFNTPGTPTSGAPAAGGTGAGGPGAPGTPTTGTNSGGTSGGTDTGSSPTDGTGQVFGGGGIIGFSPASPKKSILVYKKKDHYNQWEFTYSPLIDQQMMSGGNAGGIGTPMGGTNQPPTTIGPTNNTGSTPIAPPTTNQPQQ